MDQTNLPEVAVFRHRIKVRWSDCDPAQIAYTGRIPYFALEAIDAWWESVTGTDWFRLNVDRGMGAPFVHLSVDFRAPVTPRAPLDCEVRLTRLGESSIGFAVRGLQDGTLCFEGRFVEAFVIAHPMRKTAIPAGIRARMEPYLVAETAR
ncbi:acyl-CoA thioesterase [Maritimibacter sp. 55A14]|uniref:acyl-CoA thioesterase n=1 Tax=Maritimibacter sp. 55A14 TaxID=2174844 RepID=UPI000D6195FC|nr:thioesterase family protein [Maritimibacter sp. 55A14]PWE34384.1 acyl-CoA thioesterase [Maritimibacter sp. 55A14]